MSAQGGDVIRGTVFKDTNANGRRDPGEAGMGGIAVTDGVTFARTSSEGSFVLELGVDPVLCAGGVPTVSVRFPSDHWPTTPWFVRCGSGEPACEVTFGLRAEPQPRSFVFVHGTDPHAPRAGEERLIRFREDLEALREIVRFCILTGDMADLADSHTQALARAEFTFFERQAAQLPVPWFGLPGNHDIAGVRAKKGWDTNSAEYGYGLYSRHVGPLRWSFDYADIHFAGVDYNRFVSNRWEWGVPESSARWLAEDLASVEPGRRIFLFVHHPAGSAALTNVLTRFPVTQIFFGHDHHDGGQLWAGVPGLSAASIAEVFDDKDRAPGYRLVHVTPSGIDTFYRATGEPHAVTVDYPRYKDTLVRGNTIRGAFFDPSHTIRRFALTYAGRAIECRLRPGPFWCRFEGTVEAGDVARGAYPLVVTLGDTAQSWRHQFSYRFARARAAASR
ncbi:MAG: metallophosphoesterase [Verrucomicrobia bacterium]|nr:metallophosphoesterase [Verrucomicrobiota bacterium]